MYKPAKEVHVNEQGLGARVSLGSCKNVDVEKIVSVGPFFSLTPVVLHIRPS